MASTPPSASAFLQKHTHHADDEEKSVGSSGAAAEIVSNFIEGMVGGATTSGEDDSSVSSMKHRKESSKSYDQRLPKTYNNNNESGGSSSNNGGGDESLLVGFGRASLKSWTTPDGRRNSNPWAKDNPDKPRPFAGLRYRLRGFFSPRATDIQQLLIKLENQFDMLEVDHERYKMERDGSVWDEEGGQSKTTEGKDDRKDPKHPLNNPSIMTEVHFVGRKAIDSSIIELSTLLTNFDKFGSITELWLNDNLISDDGAAAIASFLQLSHCALIELWLGSNEIGPAGTTLISAALSNNENSKLKCLGLYKNPIGNGGASTLAQMLRKNHKLTTVDVHGCGSRNKGPEVLESYGCKVVKASDGTEYVARVVAPNTEEREGYVTDQRLLDSIQTFVAFNRINPTREQAIRGMMASNKHIQDDNTTGKEGDKTSDHKSNVSKFLSELCNLPSNDHLTDEEKQTWKDCEWERLHVELERSRAAKSALAKKLEVAADEKDKAEDLALDEEDGNMKPLVEDDDAEQGEEEEEMIGPGLDDEVVRTDSRSWRDLKMGITGSTKPNPRDRKAPANEHELYVISDFGKDKEPDKEEEATETEAKPDLPPPQSTFL